MYAISLKSWSCVPEILFNAPMCSGCDTIYPSSDWVSILSCPIIESLSSVEGSGNFNGGDRIKTWLKFRKFSGRHYNFSD